MTRYHGDDRGVGTGDGRAVPDGLSSSTEPKEVSALTGFDPSRIARSLRKKQRALILSLRTEWGRADQETARRMWGGPYGYLIQHKHGTLNCWRLSERGLMAKAALVVAIATEARRAETPQSDSVHEGAGPQDIAQ